LTNELLNVLLPKFPKELRTRRFFHRVSDFVCLKRSPGSFENSCDGTIVLLLTLKKDVFENKLAFSELLIQDRKLYILRSSSRIVHVFLLVEKEICIGTPYATSLLSKHLAFNAVLLKFIADRATCKSCWLSNPQSQKTKTNFFLFVTTTLIRFQLCFDIGLFFTRSSLFMIKCRAVCDRYVIR